MKEEEAVARAEEFLRTRPDGDRTTGPAALRVVSSHQLADGGWFVTVDAVDPAKALDPKPVLTVVPDRGVAIYRDSRFVEWRPEVDPEFDAAAFPGLPVPPGAIYAWRHYTPLNEPTGDYRLNEQASPGPLWRGFPRATTSAGKLLNYLGAGWIGRSAFAQTLLDCEVLVPVVDGELLTLPSKSSRDVIAYTSSAMVPAKYSERLRMRVRDLIAGRPTDGLTLDPGTGQTVSLTPDELGDPGEQGSGVPAPAPETGPEVTAALPDLAAEFGVDPGLLQRHLAQAVAGARAYRFELTPEECLRYLRGFGWQYRNGERRRAGQEPEWPDDLAANGLVAHVGEDGEPRPVPWTFGKFFATGTPSGRFAWHRLVGAYVGFAIGDALGSGADPAGPLPLGGLTRQLLWHTEAVIRGLAPITADGAVPASLPATDPDGWLARATAHAGPAPAEFSALLAAALAATPAAGVELADVDGEKYAQDIARELIGSGAGPEVAAGVTLLVKVFKELLTRDEFAWPVHVVLEQLGVEATLLELREDRAADDVVQCMSLGEGRTPQSVLRRALFAAAKRGHDPERALGLAARSGPVAAALAGAMIGARVGVPGLPANWVAALPDLGLLDNVASDAFWHFNRNGVASERSELQRWERRYPSGLPAKARRLPTASRLRGSLLAGAIGDALGAKT
ncbi:MAG TPA: SseB family protein, partial [Amycolatopsis sp.]|nr:SseB family protein [Amycolatopsis sp.]